MGEALVAVAILKRLDDNSLLTSVASSKDNYNFSSLCLINANNSGRKLHVSDHGSQDVILLEHQQTKNRYRTRQQPRFPQTSIPSPRPTIVNQTLHSFRRSRNLLTDDSHGATCISSVVENRACCRNQEARGQNICRLLCNGTRWSASKAKRGKL